MSKKYIRIIEFVIWLLVLSCGLSLFFYKTVVSDSSQSIYYIFFDDAAGLVKGSPVRLMGINIGIVKDVKIVDNKVFVSILVIKKNIKIPKNATATVEFYGLGGSTSLELTPSIISENENIEEIIPSAAYRIQDYWNGQKLTANTMINIYGSVGRNIEKADLLNNKQIFFQSSMVEDLIKQTQKINHSQSVIINKLNGEEQKKKEN